MFDGNQTSYNIWLSKNCSMNGYDKQSNNVGCNNVVSIDTTMFDSLASALKVDWACYKWRGMSNLAVSRIWGAHTKRPNKSWKYTLAFNIVLLTLCLNLQPTPLQWLALVCYGRRTARALHSCGKTLRIHLRMSTANTRRSFADNLSTIHWWKLSAGYFDETLASLASVKGSRVRRSNPKHFSLHRDDCVAEQPSP